MRSGHEKTVNLLILSAIFLLGVCLHFLAGNFPKSVNVYPDEVRYYSIARDLYLHHTNTLRGASTDFQKLGYALFLAPFFAIEDAEARIRGITLMNCMLMVSTVFPLWLIGRRLGLGRWQGLALCAFFLLWPDLLLSSTFMAEILYLPLMVWFFWLWMVAEEKRKPALYVLLGILGYACYFTKEIALALFTGWGLYALLRPLLLRRKPAAGRAVRAALALLTPGTFLALHILLKLTVFRGLGNSYHQMSLDALSSFAHVLFLLGTFLYQLLAILLSVLLLPVLFPAVHFSQLKERTAKLYLFLLCFLVTAAGVISYTISVREEFGRYPICLHFRYLGPALLLLLPVAFESLGEVREESGKRHLGLWILLSVCTILFFRGSGAGACVAQSFFWEYSDLADAIRRLPFLQLPDALWPEAHPALYFLREMGIFLFPNLRILAVAFLGMALWNRKHPRAAVLSFAILLGLNFFLNVQVQQTYVRKDYGREEACYRMVMTFREYLDKVSKEPAKVTYMADGSMVVDGETLTDGSMVVDGEALTDGSAAPVSRAAAGEAPNVLVIVNGWKISTMEKTLDTYLDLPGTVIYQADDRFLAMEPGTYPVSELDFTERLWGGQYPVITHIDYILLDAESKFELWDPFRFDQVEPIYGIGGAPCYIFRCRDPEHLTLQ